MNDIVDILLVKRVIYLTFSVILFKNLDGHPNINININIYIFFIFYSPSSASESSPPARHASLAPSSPLSRGADFEVRLDREVARRRTSLNSSFFYLFFFVFFVLFC